jgi:hypothetical protein
MRKRNNSHIPDTVGNFTHVGERMLLYELSGVSDEVHRKWTHSFLDKFSKDMYHVYVHGPRNSEKLNSITSLYGAAGFALDLPNVCIFRGICVLLCGFPLSRMESVATLLLRMR